MPAPELEALEIALVERALNEYYGYDFSHYARASFKRRLQAYAQKLSLNNISDLIPRLLHDAAFCSDLIFSVTVNTTEMFRDPDLYKAIREEIVPVLKTYPSLKVWHAGCSTGEEVYSLAILFAEEGLGERTQVYATDLNESALDLAREGIYPLREFQTWSENYRHAGGRSSLADYIYADSESVRLSDSLRRNILFSKHNLVSDASFGEMHLVVCRNVLIYFDNVLQSRALKLFAESLVPNGFLCLGSRENLRNAPQGVFRDVSAPQRLFQFKPLPEGERDDAAEKES
jgi:chemotaxis protein methyltransferase CheR